MERKPADVSFELETWMSPTSFGFLYKIKIYIPLHIHPVDTDNMMRASGVKGYALYAALDLAAVGSLMLATASFAKSMRSSGPHESTRGKVVEPVAKVTQLNSASEEDAISLTSCILPKPRDTVCYQY